MTSSRNSPCNHIREGGWYRETWRAEAEEGVRSAGTAIYYLLDIGEFSYWHRVDAAEVWHWYTGAPLSLTVSPDGHDAEAWILGPEVLAGQWWQTATSLGEWTKAFRDSFESGFTPSAA